MKSHAKYRRVHAAMPAGIAALLLVASASPVHAQYREYLWAGNGADGNWTKKNNWQLGFPPLSGSATGLRFASSLGQTNNNDLANPFILNRLTFDLPGYNLTGGALNFREGVGVDPHIVQSIAGSNTIANDLILSNTLTVDMQKSNSSLIVAGLVSGTRGLTKTGAGMLTLTQTGGTLGGDILIDAGTLVLQTGAALSSRGNLMMGKGGSGTTMLIQDSSVAVAGTTSLTNGTNSSLVMDGGTLETGTLTGNSGSVITLRNTTGANNVLSIGGNSTFAGTIVGEGLTYKSGTGTLTLTGVSNTPSLMVAVAEGALTISGGGKESNYLTLIGTDEGENGMVTVSGKGSQLHGSGVNVGGLGKGTLMVTGGASVVCDHNSLIGDGGSVTISGAGSQWSNDTLVLGQFGAGSLMVNGGATVVCERVEAGSGDGDSGIVTVSGAGSQLRIADSLNADEATLSILAGGSVSVTGTTYLTTDSNSSLIMDGGTLTTGKLSGSSSFIMRLDSTNNTTNTLSVGDASSFGGSITGSGSLTKTGAGELTLTGANTFAGNTIINSGSIALGNTRALQNSIVAINVDSGLLFSGLTTATLPGFSGTGNLSLNNTDKVGVTLTLNQGDNTNYSGQLFGKGSLIKNGSGTLTLTGANSAFEGNIVVNQGSIVQSGGTWNAGVVANAGAMFRLENGAACSLGTAQLRANAGGNILYDNVTIDGGFLSGTGTHTVASGGLVVIGTTIQNTNIVQNGSLSLTNVGLRGNLVSNASLTIDGVIVTSSGKMIIGRTATVSDLEVDGQLTINRGGRINNVGNTPLVLGGGSRTNIGTKADITGNVLNKAVLDLGGQTLELNGALLVNNGIIQNGLVNVNYGATAKGSGSYRGGYAVNDGGKIIFGNSPGTLASGSAVWNAGANLTLQIDDATGTAGSNWGMNQINGTLTLNGDETGYSPFMLSLESLVLGSGNVDGALSHFSSSSFYAWEWVRTTGGIVGFDASAFVFDTSGFNSYNDLKGGRFSLEQGGNSLWISFTPANVPPILPPVSPSSATAPEPGTLTLLMFGSAFYSAAMLKCREKYSR